MALVFPHWVFLIPLFPKKMPKPTAWTDSAALQSLLWLRPVTVAFTHPIGNRTNVRRVTSRRTRTQDFREGTRGTYGGYTGSFRTTDSSGGYRAESWSLGAQSPAFDAELAALVRTIEICALDACEGRVFRIFTDSQTAMRRL